MSDAPETIWASTGLYYDYVTDWSEGEWLARGPHGVEYRRADLPATDAQAMANEKVQALVEALTFYSCEDDCNDCDPSDRDRVSCGWTARAALAALEVK